MARAHCSTSIFLRYGTGAPLRPGVVIRFLSKEAAGDGGKFESGPDCGNLSEIAKRVCLITRTRPRWEQSLVSDFPSFDFSNRLFLRELFKQQSNLLFSIRFFYWSLSYYGASPDLDSCGLLFDKLVEANACYAAKSFISRTGFIPRDASLEQYIICLFKGGLVDDAMEAFRRLKETGVALKTKMWNVALSSCVKARRTDLVWQLYRELVASGSLVDTGVETVGHLIRAFCLDGKVPRGYKLLRMVLEDGLVPQKMAFNKLISTYCKRRNFNRVSELLHVMIEKNCTPSICTYHLVINGLFKRREANEALRVFNELNARGYAPDRIMYATMINHLCEMEWVGEARKLWFEMISKGFLPDERTISSIIRALFRFGNVKEASRLFTKMSDKGLGESTVTYNTMIHGFILNRKIEEAEDMFQQMPQKGIARDFVTYHVLIRYFGEAGKIRKCRNLFKEAIAQGHIPPASDYSALARNLCKTGNVKVANVLLNDLENHGLNPWPLDELIINQLCEKGFAAEAKDWLVNMLKSGLRPREKTFRRLLDCLTQANSRKDSFVVLGFMFKAGCPEGIRSLLVNNSSEGESGLVET